MFRLAGPQGDRRSASRRRPRRSITTLVARRVLELPRPAGEPLPDQLEVPRRAAPALRPAARPRVPDEGRVLVRRRRRRPAAAATTRCTTRTAACSTRCGLTFRPVEGAVGRDRRRRRPRVHGGRRGRRGRLRLVHELRLRRQRRSRARGSRRRAATPAAVPTRPRREKVPHARPARASPASPSSSASSPSELLKCIVFDVDGELGLALVPGDREVNEFALGAGARADARCASTTTTTSPRTPSSRRATSARTSRARRSSSPTRRSRAPHAWITGANETDHHVRDAVLGRDFTSTQWADLVDGRARRPVPAVRRAAVGRPRHRGRPRVPARHEVLRGARRALHRRGRRAAPDGDGLLRHRRVARSSPRSSRSTTTSTGIAWPAALAPYDVHLVAVPGQGRRGRRRRSRPPTSSTTSSPRAGRRRALRRPRREPGREVRRRRPARHAGAAHRRRQGLPARRGRATRPRDRRRHGAVARRRRAAASADALRAAIGVS